MAGSAVNVGGLDVLIIRHGESTNNVVMAEIMGPVATEPRDSPKRAEAEARWMQERSTDPGLTERGRAEAEDLARVYAPQLAQRAARSGQRPLIFVSPFLRTCQTAEPLVKALGPERCVPRIRPDIFEVGGCYTQKPGGGRAGPGKCLSADDIQATFGYDVSALEADPSHPRSEGWYRGPWETDAMARDRARSIAQWLWSPELHAQCGAGGLAVLVVHGHLIDLLLKAMLGCEDSVDTDMASSNNFLVRQSVLHTPNTATALLTVLPEPKSRTMVHFLGRTDHLSSQSVL